MRFLPNRWPRRIALFVASFVCIVLVVLFCAYVAWNASRPNDAHTAFRTHYPVPTIEFNPGLYLERHEEEQFSNLTKQLVAKRSSGRVRGKIDPEYSVIFSDLANTPNTFCMDIYMFGLIHFVELSPSGEEVSSSTYRASRTRKVSEITDLIRHAEHNKINY